MSIESLRQTGRTTRLMRKAIEYALAVPLSKVYIVFRTERETQSIKNSYSAVLPTNIKIINKDEYMKLNFNSNNKTFVDHYVHER